MSLAEQQWCPTSVQVTVQQARGLRIKGKSGTNDAYAVMQVGKEKFQTSVVEKSVAPAWREEAAFDLPPLVHQDGAGGGGGGGGKERGTLRVHVLHRALVGPDKLLGQAVVNLLQLGEDKTREKTEWFKLLDKTGKADKDRGEVLLDIQFMRHNMTASMFDLSASGKSRSRMGKFKDKVRGKKKESDSASDLVPSFPQVLTESEEEGSVEVATGKADKKKKLKMKSLFSHKTNLQKNMSQSMTVLTAKNFSLSGSQSSGLNVDSSDGKKKFKFLMHKRSNSSDGKDAPSGQQKHGAAAEPSNVCINGSHVYCEEPPHRASRVGSNFSLASSGHGSMEDVPESSPPSVDSLRGVRQYSPWTEEEEEEEEEEELEKTKEDAAQLRRQEEETLRMEEMRRKEEEQGRIRRKEELERLVDEKRRREEEEEERRTEEENVRREEEERRQRQQAEEERVKREQEECDRLAEQKWKLQEQERLIEEERVRKEEEERIHEERRKEEELVRRQEEEREEKRRFEEQERSRKEEEERIRMEEESAQEERRIQEERVRQQEEERKLAEQKRLEEEERRKEEEMMRRQEEEREKKRFEEQERSRKEEEEKIRMEEESAQEERKREEEARVRVQEEKYKLAEQKRLEEEERRIEEDKLNEEKIRREVEMAEEERKRREEEEMMRRQEEMHEEKRRLEEQERRRREHEERIKKEEEQKARMEKEERERLVEEKRKLEEEERMKAEEEQKARREKEHQRLVEEERKLEEEERMKAEEEQKARREKEEHERLVEEERKLEEEERKRIKAEEKIRREEERIRVEEEERVRRQEAEREQLAAEKRILEEQERRIEKERKQREEEEIRRREEEETRRKENERLVIEKMRQQEQERRRIEEEEKIKRAEEERVRRKEKAERERNEEEARKKEKLTREAAEQKDNKTKPKAAGKKPAVSVERRSEVTSTNPFDENVSNNPFEEVPDSPAAAGSSTATEPTVQQRVQSAASSVGSKPISSDEKDPIATQRERRSAPQPPGRNPAERRSQREPGAATQQPAQINKRAKDKDIKTVSVLPQRSVQTIAPVSRSSTEKKNAQSSTQSCAAKDTSNVVKPGKRTAPTRPLSVGEDPSSEHKTTPSSHGISRECVSGAKQAPVVSSLNPFEDDDAENAAPEDSTTCGDTGSVKRPPAVSQAADKDAASQAKTKSTKAHAPPLPVKIAATSSASVHQDAERGHVAAGAGVTVNRVTPPACDTASEAARPARVQEAPQPAPAQKAGDDAGGMKAGPPIASRRLQPVKPLNPLEQQSVSVVQGVKDNNSTCDVQVKTKVNDTGLKGPYSQLTQGELISLVLKQEKQLSEREKKISELEKYIDDLIVRVIEEKPSILMSMNSMKKAT